MILGAPTTRPTAGTASGTAAQTAAARRVAELQRQAAERQARIADVTRYLRAMHPDPGTVFEVRLLDVPAGSNRYTQTASGYFNDIDLAARAIVEWDGKGGKGVYVTLNPCLPGLLARATNRIRFCGKNDPTTKNHEILRRTHILVDIDSIKVTGVSATQEELDRTLPVACDVEEALRQRFDFPAPLRGISGNGHFLHYSIDLPNDAESDALVKRFLEALPVIVSTTDASGKPLATIDPTMHNAARITRIAGTLNRKGDSTTDRPHRRCELFEVDPADDYQVGIVSVDKIREVAALAPTPSPAQTPYRPGTNGTFEVETYLREHNVGIRSTDPYEGGTKYILERCVWNQEHTDKSAFVIRLADGRIVAGCQHQSCIGKGWHDLRDTVEPGWRERPKQNGSTKARRAVLTPIPAGTTVKALDRGNFGDVVSDNGDSLSVHFVSEEGQHATIDLPRNQLRRQDGSPLDGDRADGPPRFITTLLTSAQLDDLTTEPRYIVRNAVPAGQVGAAGAKSKGCKTGIATDLVISGASGTRFLNEFEVPEAVPVLDLCGESGASKIRRQARHICEARGLSLRDLPIFWGFDLPKLCLPLHVDALADFIRQNKIALAIIDPLYLALFTAETAGRSGDLYTMGATFEPLTAVCRETGASILLVHYFRKNRGDDQQEPCSLEELSQAGLAEVARWWMLLERREPYAGDGRHSLWLRVGGSEGHASFWGLDIDEGLTVDSEGNQRTTKWETTLSRVQDTKAEEKRQREHRQAVEMEKRDGEHVDKLVCRPSQVPGRTDGPATSGRLAAERGQLPSGRPGLAADRQNRRNQHCKTEGDL